MENTRHGRNAPAIAEPIGRKISHHSLRGRVAGQNAGPLLTTRQVAERLAISEKSVRRLIDAGELPTIRVCRSIRIDPADLEAFIHRNRV
jgi:excisionase family DNA binding protein